MDVIGKSMIKIIIKDKKVFLSLINLIKNRNKQTDVFKPL